jgi:lipopolysaccharide/colanic/teichoic acid biosynthesis glycosyltransferase
LSCWRRNPRPHLPQHDEEFTSYTRGYRSRFLVKPGITGLAQCHGFRGEITEIRMIWERVHYDLEYITRWSIWLDVQIMFRTAWQIIFPPKSAY